jgi:DNA helicase II / ATP-dependent DNA helicase PcrA
MYLCRMSYLDSLNPTQRAAVLATEGPTLVIAGPGSGKTRVLTYRIAHLIEQQVAPWQILTLTFTNKAAREMKERIERVVGERAQAVWAGTFHSIFARILRAEASLIGYPTNFTIYDTEDTTSLLRTIIKEQHLDPQAYNASAVRSRISLAKSNLLTPAAYRSNADWMAQDRQQKRPYIVDIYEKYMQRCQLSGAMDFDDLLLQLFRLLRDHEEVAQKYRQRFKYIHVDEFQDTNFLQYAILRRLIKYPDSPENLFVVGDDAQSIYAFRGATIDNILDFEKDYPQLRTIKLEQNYRSTHHIVAAANEVISHNRKQLNKTIWTEAEDSQKIKLIKTGTDDEEARRVADAILEQKNRYHLLNQEIAILYRTNAQSRKFEEHLRRLNLPYRVYGGLSFYQRKEVKDLVAYLRLAVNPRDEEALRRVINYPTRGLSDATVEKISSLANERNEPMWAAMLHLTNITDRARKSLGQFRTLIEGWHKRATISGPDNAARLATDILRQSGLLEMLKSDTTPEGISRLENVNSVLDAIAEFVDNAPADAQEATDLSLAAYLQTITLLTEADQKNDQDDFITLMSVHSAKGLEYRSVFVTGLEEQLFPSFMSFEDPNGLDEERRLFYVAITRAKAYLTLTFTQNRYRFGQLRTAEPSRFLSEIGQEHFELLGGYGSARSGVANRLQGVEMPTSSGARVIGAPVRRNNGPIASPAELANFKPSPEHEVVPGVRVLHQKFGKGDVKSVDGPRDGRVAAIKFDGDDAGERRIVLKFAKLQVIE